VELKFVSFARCPGIWNTVEDDLNAVGWCCVVAKASLFGNTIDVAVLAADACRQSPCEAGEKQEKQHCNRNRAAF